jgi:hypothetical protein
MLIYIHIVIGKVVFVKFVVMDEKQWLNCEKDSRKGSLLEE